MHIDHINISVCDLSAATEFFVHLGFEVKKEANLQGKWIDHLAQLKNVRARFCLLTLPGAQTNLELIEYFSPQGDKDAKLSEPHHIGFRHIAFAVPDIEIMHQKLQQMSLSHLSDIQVFEGKKKLCYFTGPDNILLELAEYTSLKKEHD